MTRLEILKLLEPSVQSLGYGLVDVDLQPRLLRLYIEHDNGVTLDDCQKVSRQISALLDVEDPIQGEYALEVSSPGANRILRTPAHFAKHAGERVKIRLVAKRNGQLRFIGTLAGFEGDDVVLDIDGEEVRLPINGIERARVSPQ